MNNQLNRTYIIKNNKIINKIKEKNIEKNSYKKRKIRDNFFIIKNFYKLVSEIVIGEKEFEDTFNSIILINNEICNFIEVEYPIIVISKENCYSFLVDLKEDIVEINLDEEYYNKQNNDKMLKLLKINNKEIDLKIINKILDSLFNI